MKYAIQAGIAVIVCLMSIVIGIVLYDGSSTVRAMSKQKEETRLEFKAKTENANLLISEIEKSNTEKKEELELVEAAADKQIATLQENMKEIDINIVRYNAAIEKKQLKKDFAIKEREADANAVVTKQENTLTVKQKKDNNW